MSIKYFAACVLAVSATWSHAGGYVGASVGQTDLDIPGFDDGTSFALIGGYKVNENFAIEGSYVDLGESEDDIAPVWTIEADGLNFAAVGILPANEKVDLFAKIGVFAWDITLDEAGFGELASDDGTDLSYGLGASVDVTDQFGLVLEYQNFGIDEEDVTNISVGARLLF